MRILITGASGFIGSALLDVLLVHGHTIFCQSRFAHDDSQNVKWIKHDLITDCWESKSIPEIDVIFHLAGQTSVYRARDNPIEDLSVNVLGLVNMLDHFKNQISKPFVVFAGTATEVGLTDNFPINESFPDRPITFYDVSKVAAEMYLKQYVREGWINGCALRFSNVYGRSKFGSISDRGILDKIFNQAISGQDIAIYGNGNFFRDYIYIDDVVSAIILAAKHNENTNGHHFYVGSGEKLTLKDAFLKVLHKVSLATGFSASFNFVDAPSNLSDIEFRNAIIDNSSFKLATGWTPQFDFDAGLDNAYGDFLKGLSKQ
jgi:nucleoside-diphosphate-sugar epimerase